MNVRTTSILGATLAVALAGCSVARGLPILGALVPSGSGGSDEQPEQKPQPYLAKHITKVDPLPGRATAKPMAVTWCNEFKPDNDYRTIDTIASSIADQIKEGAYRADAPGLATMCWKKSDPNMHIQVGYFIQSWMNTTGQSQADAVASISARMEGYKPGEGGKPAHAATWNAGIAAQCDKLDRASAEESVEDGAIRAWYSKAFNCNAYSTPKSSLMWYLDRGTVAKSELLSALGVLLHTRSTHDYLGIAAMAKRLNAQRFEQELKTLKLNRQATIVAKEIFSRAVSDAKDWERELAASAKEDPAYQQLLDASEQAWKAWEAHYNEHKSAYDAMWAFEQKIKAPSVDAAAGCSATLEPEFGKVMAAAKIKSYDDLKPFVRKDALANQLAQHLYVCKFVEGNNFGATGVKYLLDGERDWYRGPRTAALNAFVAALKTIKEKRPEFPIERKYNETEELFGNEWPSIARRFDKGEFRSEGYGGDGEVGSVNKAEGGAKVVFKIVREKQEQYKCYQSNKVQRIRDDGSLDYEKCDVSGYVNQDVSSEPMFVPAEFLKGVTPGATIKVSGNGKSVGNLKVGLPWLVTDGKGRPKVYYGIVIGS